MHKNEEISRVEEAETTVEGVAKKVKEAKITVEEKTKDLVTENRLKTELESKADKTALDSKLNTDDLEGKVKGFLPTLLVDPSVATADVKEAFKV